MREVEAGTAGWNLLGRVRRGGPPLPLSARLAGRTRFVRSDPVHRSLLYGPSFPADQITAVYRILIRHTDRSAGHLNTSDRLRTWRGKIESLSISNTFTRPPGSTVDRRKTKMKKRIESLRPSIFFDPRREPRKTALASAVDERSACPCWPSQPPPPGPTSRLPIGIAFSDLTPTPAAADLLLRSTRA